MTEVIDSYNFFINTDRNKNSDTQGDQARLNLGLQPIVCGDDEFIRLSLHMFAMRRSWTDINATNSTFTLWLPQKNVAGLNVGRKAITANLPHINTSSFTVLYDAVMSAISVALQADDDTKDQFTVKYPTYEAFSDAKTGSTYGGAMQQYRPCLVVILEQTGTEAFAETELPVIQCRINDGDSYLLFGGTRVYNENEEVPFDSNASEGISCYPPKYYINETNTEIVLEFPYNYSRRTQKMAYITTTQVNNNIATDSYTAGFFDTKKCVIESTQIMAAVEMQDEYLSYDAQTDHNYFVNFTTKQANMIEFNLVDAFGRRFPLIDGKQAKDGNRSFEMCVRVDRCRRTRNNPYDLDTKPPVKPTVPRMANGPAPIVRQPGIPGFGLNTPGQTYGDGYKPFFKK